MNWILSEWMITGFPRYEQCLIKMIYASIVDKLDILRMSNNELISNCGLYYREIIFLSNCSVTSFVFVLC